MATNEQWPSWRISTRPKVDGLPTFSFSLQNSSLIFTPFPLSLLFLLSSFLLCAYNLTISQCKHMPILCQLFSILTLSTSQKKMQLFPHCPKASRTSFRSDDLSYSHTFNFNSLMRTCCTILLKRTRPLTFWLSFLDRMQLDSWDVQNYQLDTRESKRASEQASA